MSLNLYAYIIYLVLTFLIILVVGKYCYVNGAVFIQELLHQHTDLAHQINRLLLIGYYLLNGGYCALALLSWQPILSVEQLIQVVCFKIARIVLVSAVIHYGNIFMLYKYAHKLV